MNRFIAILFISLLQPVDLYAQPPLSIHIEIIKDSIWFVKALDKNGNNAASIKYNIHYKNNTDSVLYLPHSGNVGNMQTYLYHNKKGLILVSEKTADINTDLRTGGNLLMIQPKKTYIERHAVRFADTVANMISSKVEQGDLLLQEQDSTDDIVYKRLPNGAYQLFAQVDFIPVENCQDTRHNNGVRPMGLMISDTAWFYIRGDYPNGVLTWQKKNRKATVPGGIKTIENTICASFDTLILSKREIKRKFVTSSYQRQDFFLGPQTATSRMLLTCYLTIDTNGKIKYLNDLTPKSGLELHVKKVLDALPIGTPAIQNGQTSPYFFILQFYLERKSPTTLRCSCP
ncbi:MAG: hypothetical protein EAY81_03820 [Bacteroidetes bacterium]|nr:MAG: hypothetical protein EAY81_03820 [Bacteroidota bacterium]